MSNVKQEALARLDTIKNRELKIMNFKEKYKQAVRELAGSNTYPQADSDALNLLRRVDGLSPHHDYIWDK